MLKGVFSFAEHQENSGYRLGYKLILARNSDNSVLNKDNAINNAEIKIISIEWFVPRYTPSFPQHASISKQISSKTPTELRYVEISVS